MQRSNRNLWIGIGILAVVVLLALPAWGGGMMVGGPGAFAARPFMGVWGFWTAEVIVRLLFFGLLAFLILRLFRGRGYGYRGYDRDDYLSVPPAEILRRRYAAGEITRDQYEDMRHTLEAEASTT
jgi:putative membrane protein